MPEDQALEQPEPAKEPKIINLDEAEPIPEIPDWMLNLADEPEAPPETTLPPEALADEPEPGGLSDIPDWMADLEADEIPSAPDASVTAEAETAPDLPDWMLDLEADVANETEAKVDAQADGEADWLAQLRTEATDEAADSLAEPDAVPDWMQNLEAEPLSEQEAEPAQQITAAEDADAPAELESLAVEPEEKVIETEAEQAEDTLDWMADEEQAAVDDEVEADQALDWLATLRQETAQDEVEDESAEIEAAAIIPDRMVAADDETPPEATVGSSPNRSRRRAVRQPGLAVDAG